MTLTAPGARPVTDGVVQERRPVTPLPGLRSQELMACQIALIDLGSGIAVTTAPRVVEAVQRHVEAFTRTCSMVTPYDGDVAVAEALDRLTPGDHAERTELCNSGALLHEALDVLADALAGTR